VARAAREESSASTDAELATPPGEVNSGQSEKQGENPASSDSRAFEDPEKRVMLLWLSLPPRWPSLRAPLDTYPPGAPVALIRSKVSDTSEDLLSV